MEENRQTSQIEVMSEDAIVVLKYNRSFYQRLVMVFNSILDGKTAEEIQEANRQITEKNITEPWVANFETMLYIIQDAEQYVRKNGMTKMISLDEMEKSIKENPVPDLPKSDNQ